MFRMQNPDARPSTAEFRIGDHRGSSNRVLSQTRAREVREVIIQARQGLLGGLLLFSSGLTLLACQQTATAPANRHVSDSDLQFITGLTNLVKFDSRVIGSELDRNPDIRVKALALYLQTRVTAFNTRVKPIAERDGIVPPNNVTLFEQSDMHSRVATLMATSKYDFDQEFLSDELYGNRQVLRQAELVVSEPAGDPELRVLASEAVVRLKEDVHLLESLQAQMKS